MESDDEFQTFSPPKEPSPPRRRLKRLKKSSPKSTKHSLPEEIDDPLLFSHVDFAKLEALENDSEPQCFDESNSTEEANLSQESLSQGIENEVENGGEMELGSDVEVPSAKRVLEFDAEVADGVHENEKAAVEEDSESFEQEKIGIEGLFEETEEKKKKMNKKKKREKSDSGDELKTGRGSNKRREEKERKAYLKELHAESQRLLRETRDASFRPIPVVQKPISSVLEKIRKRKLEITKKSVLVNDSTHSSEGNIRPRDRSVDFDVSSDNREENVIKVEKEMVAPSVDGQSSLASNVDNDAVKHTGHENDQNPVLTNAEAAEPSPAFRAPVDDTQDLFDDSEPNCATAVQNDEQPSSPLEEDFTPSLLAMDLKFDSAPVDDDCSSEEEDNDKENVDPHSCGIADGSSSPKGDPVKDFIDDEAEDEDESDVDLNPFLDNETADDIDDFEELNDMIATEYEEKPIDKERRDELHQKWLEQQDAAGTDNLMQKFKCGSALRDTFLVDSEPETDEDDEEFEDEAEEASLTQKPVRVNIRKAKQIILELLSEKEDTYLSDDDDGTLRRHAQCFIRKEEQAKIESPNDDASSSEVFGLIKRLNIASENKKKPKALSIFDSVLNGGNGEHSSKSSFLGRASNHSVPSSHKQGSATVRSFIFGRDDSNSRSSMSISEDSSDTVSRETRPTKNLTAKYSSSQTKVRIETNNAAVETLSRTSLLEILKRSSSQVCNQDTTVDLTKSMFAFRAPKKPTKIEGRS